MPTAVRRRMRLGALASSRFFSLVTQAMQESTQGGGLRKKLHRLVPIAPIDHLRFLPQNRTAIGGEIRC